MVGTSEDAVALCLATAAGEHPSVKKNRQVMAEALVPEGRFSSVSFEDQRNLGNDISAALQMVGMIGPMATMGIPDPDARRVVGTLLGMVNKLAPVARKIDFYKSTATLTNFNGKAWLTRSVTHYVAPGDRASGDIP